MSFNLWDWLSEAGEDVGDFLDNPSLIVARESAKTMASHYHLGGNREAFEELWGLMICAMLENETKHLATSLEVGRQISALATLTGKAPLGSTGRPITGLDHNTYPTVQVASTSGKYVVFSDHHMLDKKSRQNFFTTGSGGGSGNRDLYVEVLEDYYGASEYTLIENGDVEELLIFEPVLAEIEGIGEWGWDRIIDYRKSKQLPQLESIVRDNPDYYRVLSEQFIEPRRYFKITGNHDRDMSDPVFAGTVSRVAGIDFPLASDALLLSNGARFTHIICHGHQFDTSCTPMFADRLGESFTQASAWAFQGPDRVWRVDFDPIDEWLSGAQEVNNNVVTDEPAQSDGADIPVLDLTPKEVADLLASLLGSLDSKREWENIYDKNIAWEYFENANPQKAIDDEVKTGHRWFKFRHLNEIRIVDELRSAFPGPVPTLILGHSHEPRFMPGRAQASGVEAISFYLNSGSTGRFENLIWGIELLDGVPSLISWHRARDGQPTRTVWKSGSRGTTTHVSPASSATLAELIVSAPDLTTLYLAVEHAL
ncbi:MAG: hypothetical protein ABI647_15600 [Gemmatimonadota bacterium]